MHIVCERDAPPHLCGVDPRVEVRSASQFECSPRTRGWPGGAPVDPADLSEVIDRAVEPRSPDLPYDPSHGLGEPVMFSLEPTPFSFAPKGCPMKDPVRPQTLAPPALPAP